MFQNNRQTIKHRRKYCPKCARAAFLRLLASKLTPGAETDPKKSSQIDLWTSFWETKTSKNQRKSGHVFRCVFWTLFLLILLPFWKYFASIFIIFLDNFSETAILWKIASRLYETTIFKVWRPQKSIKNQQKIVTESRMRFLSHFDQNRPSFWPPKWSRLATGSLSKTCPKFDLEKRGSDEILALVARSPPYRL